VRDTERRRTAMGSAKTWPSPHSQHQHGTRPQITHGLHLQQLGSCLVTACDHQLLLLSSRTLMAVSCHYEWGISSSPISFGEQMINMINASNVYSQSTHKR
jgi:hypothetical protein